MNFTSKQLQYLFYIDYFKNSGRPVTDLAEQLRVTKGAVSQILDIYGKMGWIKHSPYGEIALEGPAKEAVAEIKKKLKGIYCFFEKMPDMEPNMALDCALQYICLMPRQSVDGLIWELNQKDRLQRIRWDLEEKIPSTVIPFSDGSYLIPFSVYKADCNEFSMWDKGFVKPSKMLVINGEGTITLTAKEFRDNGNSGEQFRGKLNRLSCLYKGEFSYIRAKKSEYTIPLYYIRKLSLAPDGTLCGTLRIRAEAGKCGAGMPVSEADILFSFA